MVRRAAHEGFSARRVDSWEAMKRHADEATDAILMYVEGIRDARRYLSALRAAMVVVRLQLNSGVRRVFVWATSACLSRHQHSGFG